MQAIAVAFAEAGRIDEALQLARTIPNQSSQSSTLNNIVYVLAKAGKIDEALQIAETIDRESPKMVALIYQAGTLLEIGQVEPAFEIFNQVLSKIPPVPSSEPLFIFSQQQEGWWIATAMLEVINTEALKKLLK